MALEIQRKGSPYVYQIDPDNPLVIERSKQGPRRSWKEFRKCATPEEARQVILRLNIAKEGK